MQEYCDISLTNRLIEESRNFIASGIWDIPDYEYNDLDLERPEDEE
jgi:hypothetical protein